MNTIVSPVKLAALRTLPSDHGLAHRYRRWVSSLALVALVSACSSAPPVPDWQGHAFSALNSATSAYLEGNGRVADFEFKRAQSEVARTGRPDLMARLALVRCAAQVASLQLGECEAYTALAPDAQPAEQNYAHFLAGHWVRVQPDLLPEPYRDLAIQLRKNHQHPGSAPVHAPTNPAPISALAAIKDPFARLIAAGVLFNSELIAPVDIWLAAHTASDQGWRRPLLAWLGVQRQRAAAAGDITAAAQLQRRIDLVLQNPAR